jgi:hypothetical protein
MHLARERARDLSMSIEAQSAELARYTSTDEVAHVRAELELDELRADWLHDLRHHRREAFWCAFDDAA